LECLDEQLVEYASGGAIAVTGPNPCGTPTGNHYLYREMMQKIYVEHELVLGRIVYDAKCRIINQYFPVDSLYGPAVLINLLGDPALRIKYGPPVMVGETKATGAPDISLAVYPNPCRKITTICIGHRTPVRRSGASLQDFQTESMELQIFNIQGRLIRYFSLCPMPYALCWEGTDQGGSPVPSGVYFVRATADGISETKTILLIR